MTRFLCKIWLVWLMVFTITATQAVNIKDVYYNRLPEKAQIVLVADGILAFEKLELNNPPRLVIDVPNGIFNAKKSFQIHEGAIKQIRTGYFQNANFRIVVDLKNPVRSEVYKKVSSFGGEQQVIVDIFDQPQTSLPPTPVITNNNGSLQLESLAGAPTPAEEKKTTPQPLLLNQAPASVKPAASQPSLPPLVTSQPPPAASKPLFSSPTPPAPPQARPNSTQEIKIESKKAAPNKPPLRPQRDIVIAIDPGHGGKDPGARNRATGLLEKDVVLQIGKRLKRKIDSRPGFRAIMTRDRDIFIPLQQRAKIARHNNADLFVSIHADAVNNIEPSGSSVYILSTKGATSQLAKFLENSENSVDLRWGVDVSKYDDDIQEALLTIQQEATLESSFSLAEKTLSELKTLGKVHKRNVERANFVVLRSPEIPSMLVETAFISNPDEARKLASPSYQERLAEGIANGIFRYFKDHLPQHRLLGQ